MGSYYGVGHLEGPGRKRRQREEEEEEEGKEEEEEEVNVIGGE